MGGKSSPKVGPGISTAISGGGGGYNSQYFCRGNSKSQKQKEVEKKKKFLRQRETNDKTIQNAVQYFHFDLLLYFEQKVIK